MHSVDHSFGNLVALAFLLSVAFIAYRLSWRLAYSSERLIIALTRTGLAGVAKTILSTCIGYTERTYRRSRYIVWNQVHVRFFMLWGGIVLVIGLLVLLRVPVRGWMLLTGLLIGARLLMQWASPRKPPIHTRDPLLKQLIRDVNEPGEFRHSSPPSLLRHWDYVDELFADTY